MVSRTFALIFILLTSLVAHSTVTIQSINTKTYSAATGALFNDTQTTVNTVYGGHSGTCTTSDSSSTCDSCAAITAATNPIPACNSKRIHDSLLLEVTILIEGDGTETGKVFIAPDLAIDGGAQAPIHEPTDLQNVSVGSSVVVRIPWSKLCNYLSGDTTGCAESTDSTGVPKALRIGIDYIPTDNVLDDYSSDLRVAMAKLSEDPDAGENALCNASSLEFNAACNFITYPGDGKVYIENVRTNCSIPTLPGAVNAKATRVYYQEASVGTMPNQKSGKYVDLDLSSSTNECASGAATKTVNLVSNEVTGLTNDTDYLFSIGIVDIAGNVGLVTNDGSAVPGDTSKCYDATETPDRNCHRATPSEVAGLLTDELDCFITTAAYGSPFQAKVQTFRKFRNQFLKTNALGRLIINTYYKNSPPVARWIDQNPQSRPYIRALLWPLWFIATLFLHWPLAMTFALFIALFILVLPRQRKEEF